jgi:hypothetical protein
MAPLYGFATGLYFDSAAIGSGSVRVDFLNESLAADENFPDANGLRGTRARSVERIRQGIRRIGGQIHLQPNSLDLSKITNGGVGTNCLMSWIFGGVPSGSGTVTYPLGDSLQAFNVMVDRSDGTNGKVFTYNGVKVNRATFRANQGEPLDVLLDVCGIDESIGNAGTAPSIALDTTTRPFILSDLVMVINSVTYNIPSFELVIDNAIDTNRFFNSNTATALIAADRHVLFNTELPYGDATAAYNTGPAGVAVTATFTNGSAVLAFSVTRCIFPRHSPTVRGRQEVMLPMRGVCMKSGSTLEVIPTLNPGP